MPIGSFNVNGPTEIHLLRGGPYQPVLSQLLRFVHSTAGENETWETLAQYNQNARSTNAVTVSFRPLSLDAALMTHAGSQYTGFGVTLHDTTGALQLSAVSTLANFIVKMTVTDTQDNNRVYTRHFRIHLHNDLTSIRLTPAELSLPRQTPEFSFSLYARFSDNVEADISHYPGISWNMNGTPMTNALLTIPAGTADGTALHVTASLTVNSSPFNAQGIARPFSLPTELTLMNGPGQAAAANVPNVLMLADGFTAADSDKFDAVARNFLAELAQTGTMFPFNLFAQRGAMNVWKCFVPSRQPGISCRAELIERPGYAQQLIGLPVPEKPEHENPASSADAGTWRLSRLIWVFGLATPQQSALSVADIKTYWKTFSTVNDGDIDSISPALVTDWKNAGKRHLLSENDTFLGTAIGSSDQFNGNAADLNNLIYFFSKRMGRVRMNGWLDQLQARDASNTLQTLGNQWHVRNRSIAGDVNRKDYDLICVLVNAVAGRAVNLPGGFLINITSSNPAIAAVVYENDPAAPNAIRISDTFNNIPDYGNSDAATLSTDKRTTFFHELAHSFSLGDEYAEASTDSSFERYTGSPARLNGFFANLQAESELEVPSPQNANVMQLEPQFIKWRWHRIEKCRELQSITRNGSTYTITFKTRRDPTNTNNVFAVNDKVILRYRHPEHTLKGDVRMSPVLKITNLVDADHVEAQIDNLNPFNPLPPNHVFDLINLEGDFGEFCLLYKPVQAPSSVRTAYYQFAELIGKNVLDYMTTKHAPLTASPCVMLSEPGDPQQPLFDDTIDLGGAYNKSCCSCDQRVANRQKIVGLYAGGNLKHCRIFHPAGTCIMHAHQLAEFCSVCMYILAEVIAPEYHPLVDVKIAEYYPL